jgi:ABC-type multidrug transport system ATPase subunit
MAGTLAFGARHGSGSASPAVPAIRTEGLTKRYADVDALVGLDLEIAAGEIVGYLGPNGAGKTTTLRLLLGLARPAGAVFGGILFNRRDVIQE